MKGSSLVLTLLLLASVPASAVNAFLHICGQTQAVYVSQGCCCCERDDSPLVLESASCCEQRDTRQELGLLSVHSELPAPHGAFVAFGATHPPSKGLSAPPIKVVNLKRGPPDSALFKRILLSSFLI